ncbi:MAG: hypothetical protein ACREI3_08915, partial [Nitrospirales bacterium]
MVKRSVPERALKLKKKAEWDIYLEFLKMLFNLSDRVSSLYIPVKDQPLLMDGLIDEVTKQLQATLAPALGPGSDEMGVMFAIENAVSESRQIYEPFRFVITEESKSKDEWYRLFGDRLAQLLGAPGNGMVVATATLCIGSAIPAVQGVLQGLAPAQVASQQPAPEGGGLASSDQDQPESVGAKQPQAPMTGPGVRDEIKLVSVMSSVSGEEVETRWGLHPRFRQDLKPQHLKEITRLMNRATHILGSRFAEVAFSKDWATWRRIGHA